MSARVHAPLGHTTAAAAAQQQNARSLVSMRQQRRMGSGAGTAAALYYALVCVESSLDMKHKFCPLLLLSNALLHGDDNALDCRQR